MDIKTSVFKRAPRSKKTKQRDADGKQKEVLVKGGWIYRIRYIDDDGKPRCSEHGFYSLKSQARDAMNREAREIEKSHGHSRTGRVMTFNQLADLCADTIFKPAVIENGEKIAGIKSWQSVVAQVKNLRAYFGPRRIASITSESLLNYRENRLKPQPPKKPGGAPRRLMRATVNRELSAMRRMMRHAHSKGWITRDIFYGSEAIQVGRERPRDRILTFEEEQRLIDACSGSWDVPYTRTRDGKEEQLTAHFTLDNWHLRALILLAVDTGARRGELLKMRWQDIDFDNGFIRIIGSHTKTEKERSVPLSTRCKAELEAIRPLTKGDRPFPFGDIKRSFATAKRLADVKDLRFHDLRATAGSRMSKVYPLATVAKILGHSQYQTTLKHYVGNELETVMDVKGWLDNDHRNGNSRPLNDAVNDLIN